MTTLTAPPATATTPPPTRKRRRRSPANAWLTVLLILASVFTVVPFIAVFVLAITPEGAQTIPQRMPDEVTLDNLSAVLSASSFLRWTLNSFVFSIVSVIVILLTAAMAGYAFARKRFPGSNALMWSFLATLMVPAQATLIPMFVLVSKLDGVNTFWGLIVPTLANSQAVFLMRQFIKDLPDDLFDAAKIDGAGEWTVFWRLVLPLTKPVLATLGIFVFLWHWNDFLWPLVIAQTDEMRTLTVGLSTLNAETVTRARIMASAAISVIPCLVIFGVLQRYLVNSIATTGLKG
ncbi:carbohydrate ABC transporter permease [Jiangella sp. DSM 45060]|uniref:carbohydrate ABC transporter permease n=1 Tax=Jiangella sp. DSM 45060 TaxID=1798224 RepID=UPI00087A1377|nr:carbohydrate ABC transporter permease [Jiangella sp. DSM 45060]SDT04821.1 multiple sugar transport system permease protein [Jiangella sp. DSM 45060]